MIFIDKTISPYYQAILDLKRSKDTVSSLNALPVEHLFIWFVQLINDYIRASQTLQAATVC